MNTMDARTTSRVARRQSLRFEFGTDMATPVRLAYGLGPLIQVLQAAGHGVEALLRAAEIPAFALEEPRVRIRVEQEARFTCLALEQLCLTHAGLLVGQRYHMVTFGVLGLAAACAPTVRSLLHTMLSYPVLAWGMTQCSLWSDERQSILVFELDEAASDCSLFYVERDMSCTVTVLRDMLGGHGQPLAVHFAHAAPADAAPYASFFGCPVHFGAAANELWFDPRIWKEAPPQSDEMSFRFFDNQCRHISEMLLAPLDYSDIVRGRLRSITPIPSLRELAAALRLTERSLQRRLANENTNFTALLREVRLDQARRLLHRPAVHVDQIAERLGFEDPIAFSHAFKEWTGLSPREFRCTLSAKGSPSKAGGGRSDVPRSPQCDCGISRRALRIPQ